MYPFFVEMQVVFAKEKLTQQTVFEHYIIIRLGLRLIVVTFCRYSTYMYKLSKISIPHFPNYEWGRPMEGLFSCTPWVV